LGCCTYFISCSALMPVSRSACILRARRLIETRESAALHAGAYGARRAWCAPCASRVLNFSQISASPARKYSTGRLLGRSCFVCPILHSFLQNWSRVCQRPPLVGGSKQISASPARKYSSGWLLGRSCFVCPILHSFLQNWSGVAY
jgi:hypothetical protein